MTNFDYYAPTKVVFGKGTEDQAGDLVREQGATKVLVHYGSGSVKRSGLLERIYQSLEQAGIPFVSLGGVVPNPRLSLVYQGIELCKKEHVDFILAVEVSLIPARQSDMVWQTRETYGISMRENVWLQGACPSAWC